MTSFKEYVGIPNYGKAYKKTMRHHMPQIKDFPAFKSDLRACGHSMKEDCCLPATLNPTQKNFNWGKVDAMIENGKELFPIIVSNDHYVLDGHHRWLAAHKRGAQIKMEVVDMTADEFFEFINNKPYTEKRGLYE